MQWSAYGAFLAFAIVLILIPGPDFAVVSKNALAGGRRRGTWTAAGVACSNAVQGSAAAAGLGAMIVRAQPVFEAIKWAGVGYLLYLAAQALWSAVRGHYQRLDHDGAEQGGAAAALGGWRQGFLSNITNPKVLVFYLAVLPQFPDPRRRGGGTPAVPSQPRRVERRVPAGPGRRAASGPAFPFPAPGAPQPRRGHGRCAPRVRRPPRRRACLSGERA
jgi:threonine/homoserine/homoserine lactone efflux protein